MGKWAHGCSQAAIGTIARIAGHALQIRMEEKNYVCFTGSTVLIQQIKDNMNEIPFEATITTVGSAYQFT